MMKSPATRKVEKRYGMNYWYMNKFGPTQISLSLRQAGLQFVEPHLSLRPPKFEGDYHWTIDADTSRPRNTCDLIVNWQPQNCGVILYGFPQVIEYVVVSLKQAVYPPLENDDRPHQNPIPHIMRHYAMQLGIPINAKSGQQPTTVPHNGESVWDYYQRSMVAENPSRTPFRPASPREDLTVADEPMPAHYRIGHDTSSSMSGGERPWHERQHYGGYPDYSYDDRSYDKRSTWYDRPSTENRSDNGWINYDDRQSDRRSFSSWNEVGTATDQASSYANSYHGSDPEWSRPYENRSYNVREGRSQERRPPVGTARRSNPALDRFAEEPYQPALDRFNKDYPPLQPPLQQPTKDKRPRERSAKRARPPSPRFPVSPQVSESEEETFRPPLREPPSLPPRAQPPAAAAAAAAGWDDSDEVEVTDNYVPKPPPGLPPFDFAGSVAAYGENRSRYIPARISSFTRAVIDACPEGNRHLVFDDNDIEYPSCMLCTSYKGGTERMIPATESHVSSAKHLYKVLTDISDTEKLTACRMTLKYLGKSIKEISPGVTYTAWCDQNRMQTVAERIAKLDEFKQSQRQVAQRAVKREQDPRAR